MTKHEDVEIERAPLAWFTQLVEFIVTKKRAEAPFTISLKK
jgi:hypothetical protein